MSAKKKQLQDLIKTNAGLNIKFWLRQLNLEQTEKFLDHQLKRSQVRISVKNQEIQQGVQKGNEKVQTLNKTYEQLIDIHKKWEKYKKLASTIHFYQGVLQSALCNNSQNKNMKDCVVLK